MDRLLEAQVQALHAGLQATAARPAVHVHQRLALVREIALCQSAPGLADYQRASGGAFELGRAVWLDRIAGRLRLACLLGDLHGARSALTAGRRALDARGPGDWLAALTAAPEPGGEAPGLLARCLLNLVLAQGGAPPLADAEAEARAAWQALCAACPVLARATWESPRDTAALQLRLPWRGAAARAVEAWLHALPAPPAAAAMVLPDAEAELAALARRWQQAWRNPAPDAGPQWTAAQAGAEHATAPWRALAAGATPAVARVAARMLQVCAGADCAPEVERRLIDSNLPAALAAAPLLAQADSMAARQAVWPQPLLAAHAAGLRRALAQAHTAGEVELVAAHAEACLAVEADAQRLFWAAALAPTRAALRSAQGAACAAADLRRAVRLAQGLFGLGPRALWAQPAVTALWRHNLQPALQAQDFGAWQGEAGADLLPTLRAWRAACPDADASRLFNDVGAAEPRARPRRLQLWGRPIALADWDGALGGPMRPPIPGWTEPGPVGTAL